MITTDSFKRLKDGLPRPEDLQRSIVSDVTHIMQNDKPFFNALIEFGEALKLTMDDGKKVEQTLEEKTSTQFMCVNMIYTILKAFSSSGFIEITPKIERIANNALRDYYKEKGKV